MMKAVMMSIKYPIKNVYHYVGVPGAGKTTTLENKLLERLLENENSRVMFLTFGRTLAKNTRERFRNKYNSVSDRHDSDSDFKDRAQISTAHSYGLRLLKNYKGDEFCEVIDWVKYRDRFNKIYGWDLQHIGKADDDLDCDLTNGDRYFKKYEEQTIKMLSYDEVAERMDRDLDIDEYKQFIQDLKEFKATQIVGGVPVNLMDFNDMFLMCCDFGSDIAKVHYDYVFIDEAQDFTPLMWHFLECVVFPHCTNLVFSGDDDQSIYTYQGANRTRFVTLKDYFDSMSQYDGEGVTYYAKEDTFRCHEEIAEFGNNLIAGLKDRIPKRMHSAKGEGGVIRHPELLKEISFNPNQKYMILARCNYVIKNIDDIFLNQGITFSHQNLTNCGQLSRFVIAFSCINSLLQNPMIKVDWKDFKQTIRFSSRYNKDWFNENNKRLSIASDGGRRSLTNDDIGIDDTLDIDDILDKVPNSYWQYIKACKENGLALGKDKAAVTIQTIHSAKGLECENVILLTDISQLIYNRHDENERCVWYVGVTRAVSKLYISRRWEQTSKGTRYYYDL